MTACDVVRRPYRGHKAAMEDSMSKRGGGVCGPPHGLGMGGEDGSADVAGRWGRIQAM